MNQLPAATFGLCVLCVCCKSASKPSPAPKPSASVIASAAHAPSAWSRLPPLSPECEEFCKIDDAVRQWNQLACGGVGRHLMDDDKRFRTTRCVEAWNAFLSTPREALHSCDCRPSGEFYGLGKDTRECVEYCAAARSPYLEMHARCVGIRERPRPKCKAAVTAFYQAYAHRRMRYCDCDYYTLPPPIDASIDD